MKSWRASRGFGVLGVAGLTFLSWGGVELARVARAQDGPLAPLQGRTKKLAAQAGAAVVGLGAARRNARTVNDMLDGQAGGAGFVIDAEGYIVTGIGMVPANGRVEVTFRGHVTAQARVVGRDNRSRIALLKLENVDALTKKLDGKLPVLPLGRSSDLKRGRIVATLGNPYGSLQTDGVPAFSVGVVSALGRVRDADRYKGYAIETDAAINPGSFGGPLVDLEGRAVGVVIEAVSPKRWLGVAVPIDEVALVVADLKAGRVPAGPYLGLSVATPSEASVTGLSVTAVDSEGPAAHAGLKKGDRLLELDGAAMREPYDVEHELELLSQGARVEILVQRGGKPERLSVVLGASKATPIALAPTETPTPPVRLETKTADRPWVGMNVEERDDGVFVKEVTEGGPAAKAGLAVGARIIAWNGRDVKGRKDITDSLAELAPGQTIKVRIDRDGWAKTVELTLGSRPAPKTDTPAPVKPAPDKPATPSKPARPDGKKPGFVGIAFEGMEPGPRGMVVSMVVEGSPAEKAKLQKGDVILEIDGKKVEDFNGFAQLIQVKGAGEKVKIKIGREAPGEPGSLWERTVELTLAERPSDLDKREPAAPQAWIGFELSEEKEVVVSDLAEGSPAAKAGLKKGDILVSVTGCSWRRGDRPALDAIGGFLADKKPGDTVELVVERDGWTKKVSLTLAEKKN